VPRMSGKKALFEVLRAEGTRYIFGNPGTAEAAMMDTLADYPEMEYMLAVQEGVAAGMADGYARASGKPSFLSLHINVGMLNGLSLLYDSFSGNTPVVMTAGNSDIRKLVEGRSDLTEFPKPITKWSAEVTHADQMAAAVRRAYQEARTPPSGPTFLAFAANAFDEEGEADIRPSADYFVTVAPDPAAIESAAAVLAKAARPLMLVGDRVAMAGGVDSAVRVAELIGAPVYMGTSAEVCFPTSHPQYVGPFSLRNPAARKALNEADAVLAVGVKVFGDFFYQGQSALPPGAKLVHIDSDPRELGRTERTEVGIYADPALALRDLADALASGGMSGSAMEAARERARGLGEQARARDEAFRATLKKAGDRRPMLPGRMMFEIGKVLPADSVLVDDSISSRAALLSGIKFDKPGSMIGQRGGAIGWGMGGALGVKLARPEQPVVAVVGDGSAMMTVQGLWTAANYGIPVVYVICNNASYRVLKVNMKVYHQLILNDPTGTGSHIGMDFTMPFDFARIAQAFGVAGQRVEDPAGVGPAVRKALESGKPAVVDVVIDGAV